MRAPSVAGGTLAGMVSGLHPGGQAPSAAMGGEHPGARRVPPRRRPHPEPRSHRDPRHHRPRRSGPGLALDRPARSGTGRVLQLRLPGEPRGCDIHSADRIVAEWQDIKIGDQVKLAPPVALAVAALEPGRSLVLRGGVPMGNTPAPYDFTWAWVLRDEPDGTSRLLVRERYGYTRPWARFLAEPVEAISFVMSQKMLRGIRDRAQQDQPEQSS